MSQREAMERIDRFIKNLENKDIILDPEKLKSQWGVEYDAIFGRKKFESFGSIGDMLAKYLALYQQGKSTDDALLRMELVDKALHFINIAYTKDAVKSGDGIYRKYDEAQDEIIRLKKELTEKQDELQQVSTDLLECEAELRSVRHLGE